LKDKVAVPPKKPRIRPYGSVTLTRWHRLSTKVGTKLGQQSTIDNRQSHCRCSWLADSGHGMRRKLYNTFIGIYKNYSPKCKIVFSNNPNCHVMYDEFYRTVKVFAETFMNSSYIIDYV
jgi:hypothetical protein